MQDRFRSSIFSYKMQPTVNSKTSHFIGFCNVSLELSWNYNIFINGQKVEVNHSTIRVIVDWFSFVSFEFLSVHGYALHFVCTLFHGFEKFDRIFRNRETETKRRLFEHSCTNTIRNRKNSERTTNLFAISPSSSCHVQDDPFEEAKHSLKVFASSW